MVHDLANALILNYGALQLAESLYKNRIFTGYCRFHPLSEFDEGKRSCRRRLAGHNRRRRKTQPEDVTSRLMLPGERDAKSNGQFDIFNLLAAITRSQGKIKFKFKGFMAY